MDIERVNENTLKLFITYRDIEDRGYSREEIWYNRAKGEELFWDVITEVNTDDYFELDGPIWIHINASDVGLEVIVTRASFNPETDISTMFQSMEDASDKMQEMDGQFVETLEREQEEQFINNGRYVFRDIDELIPVAKRLAHLDMETSLYQFENKYYLYVSIDSSDSEYNGGNIHAVIKEYIQPSKITIHRLQEYGKVIMDKNCFETINEFF